MGQIETEGSSHSTERLQSRCPHTQRRTRYSIDRLSERLLCAQCAILYPPVFRRSLMLSVIVGSLLTFINQGDILLRGSITALVVLKICLTYIVPFCVSTVSALAANRVPTNFDA